jgi:hypothetical protein
MTKNTASAYCTKVQIGCQKVYNGGYSSSEKTNFKLFYEKGLKRKEEVF